jgi:hypothetical protein
MTVVDDYGRPEPPLAADELTALLGFLEYQRATLAWKCRGLDAAGLNATVGVSSLTLGGILKHLAYVRGLLVFPSASSARLAASAGHGAYPTDPDWDGTSRVGRGEHPGGAGVRSGGPPRPIALGGHRGRLPTAASRGRPRARGRTASHRACGGSCSTWSRSTRGTTARPTSSGAVDGETRGVGEKVRP